MSYKPGKIPRYNRRPYANKETAVFNAIATPIVNEFRVNKDPTRTTTLRREYERAIVRRIRAVQTAVKKAIKDQDVLGIGKGGNAPVLQQIELPPRFPFDMAPAEKIDQFLAWLNRAIEQEILEVTRGPGGEITRSNWQEVYVRSAYNKGLATANANLLKAGAIPEGVSIAFNLPIDTQAISLLSFRQFELLKGITGDMSSRISQILSAGFASGLSPEEMAREIDRSFSSISIVRARILARTEIIRAYAEATLNRYEAVGVKEVIAEVEFTTAGDRRVCQICKSLDGRKWDIEKAKGRIPVHPNCRCAWLPVIKD